MLPVSSPPVATFATGNIPAHAERVRPFRLDTDPTYGLQVSVQACATAPTRTAGPPPTYACTGGFTTVDINGAASVPVASLETTPEPLTPLNSLTAAKQDYLVFTLTFPANAPGNLSADATPCSGAKGGTAATENLEGCSSTLTYNLVATQRAFGAH
jgi:hypothetical protein